MRKSTQAISPESLPVRGAWIEMAADAFNLIKAARVAPRAGSVD